LETVSFTVVLESSSKQIRLTKSQYRNC